MTVKVIFIGTGSGITSLKRYHSSFLLNSEGYDLLVDSGDGTSRALIQSGIGFSEIDSIVFTHFHPDHLNGISSLLIQMKMYKRTKKLDIFIHAGLIEQFQKFLEINYIFKLRLGFDLEIVTFESSKSFIVNEHIRFTAKENTHLKKYSDFVKPDDTSLISCGFLFEVEGKKIYYSGDIGGKEDLYLFSSADFEYLITEISHVKIQEVHQVLKELNPRKLFITHIADEIELELNRWYNDLNDAEKARVVLTYDGLIIEF